MIPRLLPVAAAAVIVALALAGCGASDDVSGSVRIEFGAGYASTGPSGWSCSPLSTTLLVDVGVVPCGEAVVVDEYWTVIEYPFQPPALSDPYSRRTTMTFPTSGIYVLDYHVRYRVAGTLSESVGELEVRILPRGVG